MRSTFLFKEDRMTENKTLQELLDLAGPMAEAMGLTVWGIEFTGGHKRRIVRIYLDSPDGVTVDQCATLSRDMSVVLDVEDIVRGSYNLEVSSPGVDRPFFEAAQLRGFEGREIQVVLLEAEGNRRKFSGKLTSVEGEKFTILEQGEDVSFDWTEVKKVNLRYEFPAKGKKA